MHRQPATDQPAPPSFPSAALRRMLQRILQWARPVSPGATPRLHHDASSLPPTPGSYLLLLELRHPLPLAGRFHGHVLPTGIFIYAGSARGPGGLRARLARHLQRHKKIRWHVDQLTTHASHIVALPLADTPRTENISECRLVELLLQAGCTHPLPGFGSSDCTTCASHLLHWPVADEMNHS